MALISVAEAAERIDAKPDTLQKMCRDGRIPSQKIGGIYLIDDSILKSIVINPRGWQKGRPRKSKKRT